jgi:hypothetical protein
VDPDVAETGQPYAFVGDDPVNASDPLGNIFEADGYTGGTVQALGTTVTAAEAAETFSGASGTASGPASTPYKSLQVNHSTTQHDDAAGPQNSFIQYTGSCLSILFLQHCSYKITGGPTYSSFGLTTNPVPSFANQSDKIISNGPVSMCSAERYLHGFTVESQVGAGVGALGGSYGDVGSLAPGSAGISAEKGFPGFGPSGGIGYSFGPNC